jgi:hypothetical protein
VELIQKVEKLSTDSINTIESEEKDDWEEEWEENAEIISKNTKTESPKKPVPAVYEGKCKKKYILDVTMACSYNNLL